MIAHLFNVKSVVMIIVMNNNNNNNSNNNNNNYYSNKAKTAQIIGPSSRIKKTVEHEGEYVDNCIWCSWEQSRKAWGKVWKNRKRELRPFRPQNC